MPLQTRKPTGRVAFPLVLCEGLPKSGKSYALAALSNSPRVGKTFVLELGEASLDEYAPLGPFELLVHDGTFSSIKEQVFAAMAEPMDPAKPNVIGLDSVTALWDLLKGWTDSRARRSQKGQAILKADPDAEIDPTMNLWNDAKARWGEIIAALVSWPGIAVLTARASDVAAVENGAPVVVNGRTKTVYKVDAEKTLLFDVTAQVRFEQGQAPRLVAVKSLFLDLPENGVPLPRQGTLDHVIFEILSGGQEFGATTMVVPQQTVDAGQAKVRLLQRVQRTLPDLTESEAKAEASRLWSAAFPGDSPKEITEAALAGLLSAVGTAPTTAPPADAPAPPAAVQAPPAADPEPEAKAVVLSADAVLAKLRGMNIRDLVTECQKFDPPLSTAGKKTVLVDRIAMAMGLMDAPFEPGPVPPGSPAGTEPEDVTPIEEPGETVDPAQADPEPIYRDIPPGYSEEQCHCGEPMIYLPGDATRTSVHLDETLDLPNGHKADIAF